MCVWGGGGGGGGGKETCTPAIEYIVHTKRFIDTINAIGAIPVKRDSTMTATPSVC